MLTVETFFERLAFGPLKNTAAVDEDNLGVINPLYLDLFINLLNQGLREITTKKMVIKGRINLTWITGQSDYVLKETNIGTYLSNPTEPGELHFLDDQLVRIIDLSAANKLSDKDSDNNLGNTNYPDGDDYDRIIPNTAQGCSSTVYNRLRFSNLFRAFYPNGLTVQYQSHHSVIATLDDKIDLPSNLEIALQLYVVYNYITDMGGAEHAKRGDEYRAKYLMEMGEDTAQNLSATSEIDLDTRLNDRGFV